MKNIVILCSLILLVICLSACTTADYEVLQLEDCNYEVTTPEGIYRDSGSGIGVDNGVVMLHSYYEWDSSQNDWVYRADTIYLRYKWIRIAPVGGKG